MTISTKLLSQYILPGDNIIVGVSGGADSMVLLDLINKFNKKVEFDFYAVHINHSIRDQEATRDQLFVENYCKKNNIKFICKSVDAPLYCKQSGKTLEQGARELRYKEFNNILLEKNANKIFVAHHANDQAETVLMHIARGSSLSGAKGMSFISNNIYRPLLNITRKQIDQYLKENKLEFVQDSTNEDITYSRNFVRREIIEKFEQIYPNFVNAVCKFANECNKVEEFIDELLPLDYITCQNNIIKINCNAKNLSQVVCLRLIKKAIEKLNVFADIEQKHLLNIIELFNKRNGSRINLTNNLIAFKEYDNVVIEKQKEENREQSENFKIGQVSFNNSYFITAQFVEDLKTIKFEKGVHYVDFEKLPQSIEWRTQQNGDMFKKVGAGNKKLCDYYTDKKIAKRLRKSLPVLANHNKIILVLGYDTAEEFKVDKNSEKVVKISFKTNNI